MGPSCIRWLRTRGAPTGEKTGISDQCKRGIDAAMQASYPTA